jgi:fructose-bisphosphate aldolase class II
MALSMAASSSMAAKVSAFNGKTVQAKTVKAQAARPALQVQASATKTTFKAGVVTGDEFIKVLDHARSNGYAIPAVNCTMSPVTNACLEAAKLANAPMMIQFSNGGGIYNIGKGIKNEADQKASIAGTIAGALHVRAIAEFYGVPIILHTDHCAKKLLPWFDGLLEANEDYFEKYGEPLFSSHMLDLSEEPLEENLEICKTYLARMRKIDCFLEMEIGITGGEEDGVDNSDVNPEELYSTPEEIYEVYKALTPIAPGFFSIAAAFGNVHGVYKAGNVKLTPKILGNAQEFIKEKEGLDTDKPVYFVFHGGSGSSREEIREAISYGVIKMNIDTDTQWSFWDGVRAYVAKNEAYLQGQIGNPEGEDKPNKNKYDPRAWMRCAELATVDRLMLAYEDLNAVGALN